MKKIIKSRIFYFALGALLFGSIGVYATTQYLAEEIRYKESNVKEALDDLYNLTNVEEYTGNTTVTPTSSNTILNTKDKLLKSNITVNAVPNTYKNLNQTTTATSANVLSGKTAYNSNGELLTGTLNPECVYGITTTTASCTTSTGCTIFEGFNPTKFAFTFLLTNGKVSTWYYDKDLNADLVLYYTSDPSYKAYQFTLYFATENNSLVIKNVNNIYANQTLRYIVCK